MPIDLVDDGSTYPAVVTVPATGDPRTALSVRAGFQALANRAAFLLAQASATQAKVVGVGASKTVVVPLLEVVTDVGNRFGIGQGGILTHIDDTSTGGAAVSTRLAAIGGTITSATMYRKGGGGHGGTAPATKPVVRLMRYVHGSEVFEQVAELVDTTSGANWDTLQIVAQNTITNATISPIHTYYVSVTGEGGADKQPGWELHGLRITVSP